MNHRGTEIQRYTGMPSPARGRLRPPFSSGSSGKTVSHIWNSAGILRLFRCSRTRMAQREALAPGRKRVLPPLVLCVSVVQKRRHSYREVSGEKANEIVGRLLLLLPEILSRSSLCFLCARCALCFKNPFRFAKNHRVSSTECAAGA